METAARSVRDLWTKPEGPLNSSLTQCTVYKTYSATTSGSGAEVKAVPSCYCCGMKGHIVAKCRIEKNIVCNNCNKRGHMQHSCKGKWKSMQPRTRGKARTVCRIEEYD